MSADDVRVAYPLFQPERSGANPTSALQLIIKECSINTAIELNKLWHSRLPEILPSNVYRKPPCMYFLAEYKEIYYASAIWTSPIARRLNGRNWLELRRMAIADDAPKNTASRMISVMTRMIRKRYPSIVKLISYQDTEVHQGTIYKASGWYSTKTGTKGEWSVPSRHRAPLQTTAEKLRWEYDL